MHLRPIEYSDLPSVIDIADTAFRDNEMRDWLFPDRRLHPHSWRGWNHRCMRLLMASPGYHGFVCVADAGDVPVDVSEGGGDVGSESVDGGSRAGQVAGYIWYERCGPTDDPATRRWRSNNTSALRRLERWACLQEEWYTDTLKLNRSLDYARWAEFFRAFGTSADALGGLPARWYVGMFAVAPRWRRRGVGTELMRWGLERAREERLPVTLYTTHGGLKLYRALGFKVVAWPTYGLWTEGNDGGALLVLDEGGEWVRDAEGEERLAVFGSRRREVDGVWTDKFREHESEHAAKKAAH